jgi:serpin B
MRHASSLTASALFLFALAGCGGSTSAGSTPETTRDGGNVAVDGGDTVTVNGQSVPVAKSTKERAAAPDITSSAVTGAVSANNAFAVDLYGQLRAKAATDNLLTSPISASLALTMTYAGALGTTATQMATAMHYGPAASTIFDGQNALSQALASRGQAAFEADSKTAKMQEQAAPSESDYQLQVVNSVWGEKTYTWNAPFLDILAEDYGTGVYLEDFVNDFDPARVLINDWVSAETANKINNLLPEGSLDKDTRMVLVNAIHLKLPWANPFDSSQTASQPFTTAAGTTVQNPFMNQTGTMSYVDDGQAQIVGLPLANNQIAVVVALPHGDLATYEASLTAGSAGIAMPTASNLVALSVPKVTFTSPTFSLATALGAMGMPVAFDPANADFKGLCTSPPDGDNLYISDVLQKAMIAMQETGVEAAAATAVIMAGASGISEPQPTPIPMTVNRPYVLSIVDVPTGTVLFLGHIVDPTQAGGS